ncbi:MAG: hypothetical protein LAO03_19295 [Acidobacteriia bacterium]|nr:hypothetical protein [Terriglobia bacterium]
MKISPRGERLREWISLVAAVAIGPASLLIGYKIPGLIFGAAAGAGILLYALVVPLLTLAAGRLKFLAWQLAIISVVLAVIGDNLRLNAIHRSEIPSVAYVFWVVGTLLSSPLPIYFLLKPLVPRQRYIVGITIGAVAFVLWFGLKRITG